MKITHVALVLGFISCSFEAFAQHTHSSPSVSNPDVPVGLWTVELFDKDTHVAQPGVLNLCIKIMDNGKGYGTLNYRPIPVTGRGVFDQHGAEIAWVTLSENILMKLNRISPEEMTGDVDWLANGVTSLFSARVKLSSVSC